VGLARAPAGTDAAAYRTPLRRRIANLLLLGAVWLAILVALIPLVQMAALVVRHALPAMRWQVLTTITQGIAGGLANALVGSALLVGLGTALAVPVGLLGGILVAELRGGAVARVVRISADVLAGVPSVAIGYFGFVALVQGLGWGFSALAGALALAVIILPYVLRTTDYAVSAVPDDLREASLALGADQVTTARLVVLRAALPGIVTGALLGIGVAVGETAPLIYTASWSSFLPTTHLVHSPVGYLTYVVWTYIAQPFAAANALAYAAALLLLVAVLLLNVFGRWVVRGRTR